MVGLKNTNPEDMTLGQKLAMKFAIPENKNRVNNISRQTSTNSEEEGSDWTWETCSDSDPEGVDSNSISTTKTNKTSVTTVTTPEVKREQPPITPTPKPTQYKIDSHTAKWLNYKIDKPSNEPEPDRKSEPPQTPSGTLERRVGAFSRLNSYTGPTSVAKSSTSTDSSSDSPKAIHKRYTRAYAGAGSKTLQISDESDEEGKDLNIGWRRGQPPRSDVVVQFKKNRQQISQDRKNEQKLPTAAERVANKILVGPIHKIPKVEPTLPPLKYGIQHQERVQMEDFTPLYVKRQNNPLETIREGRICEENTSNKALVTQVSVKEEALVLEEAEESLEYIDDEIAGFMKDFISPTIAQVEQRQTPNLLSDIKEIKSTQVQYITAPSPQPVNPFIIPKLPDMSKKPPDVIFQPKPVEQRALLEAAYLEEAFDIQPIQAPTFHSQPVTVTQLIKPEPIRTEVIKPVPSKPITALTKEKNSSNQSDNVAKIIDHEPKKPQRPQVIETPMSAPVKVEKIKVTKESTEPKKSKTKEQGAKKKHVDDGESKKKVPKKAKKDANSKQMPDLIKSTQQSSLTSEEVMNEMIQANQIIPKNVFQDIIEHNKELPSSVIAEIPMVKAAIEYNFKHEDDFIASQLERIPTPFRKFYEAKNKGEFEERIEPTEKPKYWNNVPKDDGNNPFLEMAKLKSDVKKHKEQQKAAQQALVDNTEDEPEDAWYKDESDEFQQNLKDYHHR